MASIHPRVVNGRTVHAKSTTCTKPYKSGAGKLAKKQERLNARRNDHSLTLKRVPANQQLAYKTPGAMK